VEAGQTPPGPGDAPPGGEAPQSEEELRARLEEEMRKVRIQDLVLQSVASLVNLTARRIAKEDERDLEQARIGIEAVRGLVDLLDPEPQKQVREALSELQMLYAQASGGAPEAGAAGESGGAGPGGGAAGDQSPASGSPQSQPAPSQGPGLWTPHQRD
jgi:hypothetical protein